MSRYSEYFPTPPIWGILAGCWLSPGSNYGKSYSGTELKCASFFCNVLIREVLTTTIFVLGQSQSIDSNFSDSAVYFAFSTRKVVFHDPYVHYGLHKYSGKCTYQVGFLKILNEVAYSLNASSTRFYNPPLAKSIFL